MSWIFSALGKGFQPSVIALRLRSLDDTSQCGDMVEGPMTTEMTCAGPVFFITDKHTGVNAKHTQRSHLYAQVSSRQR